ncbi:MAG TPA: transporter substrate-binding domain-containing protein [Pantanalinema sp.]
MPLPPLRRWSIALAAWLALAAPSQALQILTEDWPPFTNARQGVPEGMIGEVVQAIQERLDDHTPTTALPWSRGYHLLLQTPNVMLFSVFRTPDREKRFTLLGPVAIVENILYARRSSPLTIKRLADAKRVRRITTQRDTGYLETLQRLGFTNLDVSSNPTDSARKLMTGRVDLWSDSNLSAAYHVQKLGHSPDAIAPKLVVGRMELYFAFSRGTPAPVIRHWSAALRAMQQDGTLARIQRKWTPSARTPRPVGLVGLPPGTPMPD